MWSLCCAEVGYDRGFGMCVVCSILTQKIATNKLSEDYHSRIMITPPLAHSHKKGLFVVRKMASKHEI